MKRLIIILILATVITTEVHHVMHHGNQLDHAHFEHVLQFPPTELQVSVSGNGVARESGSGGNK